VRNELEYENFITQKGEGGEREGGDELRDYHMRRRGAAY
jgi:hypothetical protein